ncbi:MAG TPA: hypothetical protein P5092_06005 [Ruminococcus sp.]|nr:hypothetical protein [Ruminococcus sp.]
MLQDIHPHNLDIAYSADYHPDDKSIIMHYKNGKVLACSDNEHPFLFYSQIEKPQKCVYLFSVDDTKYFLAEDEDVIAPRRLYLSGYQKAPSQGRYAKGQHNGHVHFLSPVELVYK